MCQEAKDTGYCVRPRGEIEGEGPIHISRRVLTREWRTSISCNAKKVAASTASDDSAITLMHRLSNSQCGAYYLTMKVGIHVMYDFSKMWNFN